MLHVLNGDAAREKLERSGLAGDKTVWADVLHDGPVPCVPEAELRQIRAAHLATYVGHSEEEIAGRLASWDEALERFSDHHEVIFWFEHDLFDQLILIRHLRWLSRLTRGNTRFSLICIGSFPGVQRFSGFGQLAPAQIASLLPRRVPISDLEIETGVRAWELFRAADPRPLVAWLRGDASSALPFLAGALARHFEDYPAVGSGLARSERQILSTVASGRHSPTDIFAATQQMEERVYMGDATFWSIVSRLAGGRKPLVRIEPRAGQMPIQGGRVNLTDAGRSVLTGRADHLALNGIDRWMGGVHLTTEQPWRVDRSGGFVA